MPKLLTTAQLANRWRLPQRTVERLVKEGEIPILYVRQEFLFLESAIEAWENKRERKIRDEPRHHKLSE